MVGFLHKGGLEGRNSKNKDIMKLLLNVKIRNHIINVSEECKKAAAKLSFCL